MQQIFLPKVRYFVTILALCLFFTSAEAESVLKYIFGSEPVSNRIQEISDDADDITGFDTTVYKMNSFAKLLGYSSFNWFNTTWIDENEADMDSDSYLRLQLIHEKYHTIAGHDYRRIIGASAYLCWITCIAQKYKLSPNYCTERLQWFPVDLVMLFMFLWHEEYCETQANLYADFMLKKEAEEGVKKAQACMLRP